jgi:class 3 adenylate cyclase/tetratricopeptide (TPR) repeat protein
MSLQASQPTKTSEVVPTIPDAVPESQSNTHPTLGEVPKGQITQPSRETSILEQYVPKALMKKLASARASGDMVGERRVVTMLFCDLKGSTHAAEQLDPEEWSDIINGAFSHMIEPIFKYEGTVARLMGDGILAFFGAPLSHEDDPQRAILAGLDILSGMVPYRESILREWGIDFDVRIGINTGLVVVGAVGSDLRMEYTALGDAINLAARMEQTAEPGTIQIAQDTYKLVKPLFDFEDLGSTTIKGKDEPVRVYRVIGRKTNASRVRGIEGLHAEIVGRDREMEVLTGCVDDLKQGVGRIILILGEAGLGKSRLISETNKILEDIIGSNGSWYETSSLSYETNQAYALVQRLIQRISDIRYDDAPRMIQKKLDVLIEDVPEEHRIRIKHIFETLFNLNKEKDNTLLEGDYFKRELYEVMDIWLKARFQDQPTVFVFDDMHWGDGASMQLINHMLQLTEEIPIVMICAMRVELSSASWQIKTSAEIEYPHRYTEISLRPLSEADSNELVNRLLATAELHDDLRKSILDKSDGNPFFIEEVVRALIENKIVVPEERVENGITNQYWVSVGDGAEFSIPNNLQSLLAARMDQLEETTRATLQLASVIGRNFYLRVLQAVNPSSSELDKQVSVLLRLDMIRESARMPEVEYAFRNPLTQEAVYKTILLKHRREFHKRVADAMEGLYQNRLEGKFGLLSHHYSLAGEYEKAIEFCRKASKHAINMYAYDEAEKNLRVALNLHNSIKDSDLNVLIMEELADVCRIMRNFMEAINLYQDALEKLEALSITDQIIRQRLNRKIVEIAAEAKWSVDANIYRQVSNISNKSLLSLKDSLSVLEAESPHPETVQMLVVLSTDAWRVQTPSDWKCAQQYAEIAVEMADKLDDKELLSMALGALATALDGHSMLREHLNIAKRRVGLSENGFHLSEHEKIDAQRGAGLALMYVGEYAKALPYLDEAETLATNVRAPDQIANALGIKAQCLFRLDRWDEMLEVEKRWRDLDLRYTRERVGET